MHISHSYPAYSRQAIQPSTRTLHNSIEAPTVQVQSLTASKPTPIQFGLTLPFVKPLQQANLIRLFRPPYEVSLSNPSGHARTVSGITSSRALRRAKIVTIGDLHGSALKLVESLVLSDMVSMTPADAKRFKQLYQQLEQCALDNDWIGQNPKKPFNGEMINGKLSNTAARKREAFIRQAAPLYLQLQEIIQRMQWIGNDRKFIAIGDVLGDRGPLDLLQLDLFEQLPQLKHIASNHDLNALLAIKEQGHIIGAVQRASLMRAQALMTHPAVERTTQPLGDRISLFVERSPLMMYQSKNQSLYAHSPINSWHLKQLTEHLKRLGKLPSGFTYDDINTNNIQQFIRLANQTHRELVRNIGNFQPYDNKLLEFLNSENGFLWSRNSIHEPTVKHLLPFIGKGVTRFIFGHHSFDPDWQSKQLAGYTLFSLNQKARKGLNATEGSSRLHIG